MSMIDKFDKNLQLCNIFPIFATHGGEFAVLDLEGQTSILTLGKWTHKPEKMQYTGEDLSRLFEALSGLKLADPKLNFGLKLISKVGNTGYYVMVVFINNENVINEVYMKRRPNEEFQYSSPEEVARPREGVQAYSVVYKFIRFDRRDLIENCLPKDSEAKNAWLAMIAGAHAVFKKSQKQMKAIADAPSLPKSALSNKQVVVVKLLGAREAERQVLDLGAKIRQEQQEKKEFRWKAGAAATGALALGALAYKNRKAIKGVWDMNREEKINSAKANLVSLMSNLAKAKARSSEYAEVLRQKIRSKQDVSEKDVTVLQRQVDATLNSAQAELGSVVGSFDEPPQEDEDDGGDANFQPESDDDSESGNTMANTIGG